MIVLALSIDRTTGAVTPAGTIGIGGDEAADLMLCLDALDIIAQSMRRQLRAHLSPRAAGPTRSPEPVEGPTTYPQTAEQFFGPVGEPVEPDKP